MAPPRVPRIAITPGEPAGIGPDVCAQLAQRAHTAELVVIADRDVLAQRAQRLGLPLALEPFDATRAAVAQRAGALKILHVPAPAAVTPGVLDPANARYVLQTLEQAVQRCLHREVIAMVTGPVHKGVINDAGIAFTGHTEFLAERTRATRVVMMLVAGDLRVALATTHLPLAQVSAAITPAALESTLRVLHGDLVRYFGLPQPRILVCGLNPHAGEGGHLGREEIEVIDPVLTYLRAEGMRLVGPLPADTLFTPKHLRDADAVLAMYHDQGLPVLKYVGFGNAVNVTLGLPILRTSVDHGTALDVAGTGRAESGSLEAALQLAIALAAKRQ